jgi:lipoic acid synthetase
MKLRYVVVTSVTRDDLPDGGAAIFAQTIRAIRKAIPGALVEVLIPDFQGNPDALGTVVDAGPNVLNHNIETVPRLYASVRPEANYRQSLDLLASAKRLDSSLTVKSGIMLGLGETTAEIRQTLEDIRSSGCSIATIGQYLQPTEKHLPVERFVPPEEFDTWRKEALTSDSPKWPADRSCAVRIMPKHCIIARLGKIEFYPATGALEATSPGGIFIDNPNGRPYN